MRWFRRGSADRRAELDPARQEKLLDHVRGLGAPDAVAAALDGDDGLVVAARIIREMADRAYAATAATYPVPDRNYRAAWQRPGSGLRPVVYPLPGGLLPYPHLAAALTAVGANAKRCVKLADPAALLGSVLELIDLITASWEYGQVRADPATVALVRSLVATAQQLRSVGPEEPAPLPPAIRELMRSNSTTNIHDPATGAVVGGIKVGAELRPAFLT